MKQLKIFSSISLCFANRLRKIGYDKFNPPVICLCTILPSVDAFHYLSISKNHWSRFNGGGFSGNIFTI